MLCLFKETREDIRSTDFYIDTNKPSYHIDLLEVLLYVWFAAFTYDELGEFIDAGSIFYAVDIWNGCDIIIILIGIAFAITSEWLNIVSELVLICPGIVGIYKDSEPITDTAFDILSLEALFMVPRSVTLQLFMMDINIAKNLFAPQSAPVFRNLGEKLVPIKILQCLLK